VAAAKSITQIRAGTHDSGEAISHHRAMAPCSTACLAVLALAGTLAVPARAQGAPDCPVSPFGDASVLQYQAGLLGDCQTDSTRWKVEAPKAKPADVGPSLMKAEFTSLTAWRLPSLLGSLRLDWSGLRGSESAGSPRQERTVLSLGGLLRLHDSLAVQTNVGVEHAGMQRNRATVSSVWQPSKLGVLFAEWAGSELGTESHRVGGRWWLVPRRLSIDLGARHVPEGPGWVEQRVGLKLDLPL
jgi:hypothetical protein